MVEKNLEDVINKCKKIQCSDDCWLSVIDSDFVDPKILNHENIMCIVIYVYIYIYIYNCKLETKKSSEAVKRAQAKYYKKTN